MKKNLYRGKFIVIEGLDGSGQTTQANLLGNYLITKGFEVILTKEPTLDSKAGKEIKRILDKERIAFPTKLQVLFALDRDEHLKNVIIPSLKLGKTVISDRYFLSSLAYGTADGTSLEYLMKLNDKFLEPDLTILLRVSPKVCIKRIKKRGDKETLFEKEKQLERVWQSYKKLTKIFKNIIMVDGEGSTEQIAKDIKKIINQKLRI